MSQSQSNRGDNAGTGEDCHPPHPTSPPAMSILPQASQSQQQAVATDIANTAPAPVLGTRIERPFPALVLDSPFISEPTRFTTESPMDAVPTPTQENVGRAPPLAQTNVGAPPPPTDGGALAPLSRDTIRVQPPERHGTARPGDYQSGPGMSMSAHDQKLADMGSIRMGTSALISALSALPLEDESSSADEADDDSLAEAAERKTGSTERLQRPYRPKMSRMHSSLLTIRPMSTSAVDPFSSDPHAGSSSATLLSPPHSPLSPSRPSHRSHRSRPSHRYHHERLSFPYKENVITRRARAPSLSEIEYQHAPESPDAHHIMFPHGVSPLVPPPQVSRAESSATLKQEGARHQPTEAVDVAAAEDIEESALGRPERDHLAMEAAESTPQMLQEVFGLAEQEELIEEMPCWLLRSDMLQGYMYLTRRHICFFAKVTLEEDGAIKSGPLWKKASKTKLSNRYWVTLRNDVLSWYESPNDPYFPKGNVSLQYVLSCELVDETRFKLRLPERNYSFQSDTPTNAREWVRVIQKSIDTLQQEGQGVKIIIPWEAVYEVERSPTLEFQETIEIKVVDVEDAMSIDSYFFASFPDNDYAYDLLQTLLKERPVSQLPPVAPQSPPPASEKSESKRSSRFSLTGLASALPISRSSGEKDRDEERVPIAPPAILELPTQSVESIGSQSEADVETSEDDEAARRRKGYPPKLSGPPPPGMLQTSPGWGPTEWIRRGSKQLFGTSPGSEGRLPPPPPRRQSSVTEVVEGYVSTTDDETSGSERPRHSERRVRHVHGRSVFRKISATFSDKPDTPAVSQDDEVTIKFHKHFALPEKEQLLDHMSGSLYRVLPVPGRFFVSTNYFCFRSSGLLSKTKMIVPIGQLYGLKVQKAFRFGHHALVVIIKGHEELFLEFHSARRRDELKTLLEERMDDYREHSQAAKALEIDIPLPASGPFTDDMGGSGEASETQAGNLMFGSATSSFLQFKPEPMTIVCLTIGSRGDVQPYIALCKGLMAEGHTCRIATHAEYQDWVEGHGIEFAPVGGDPAKLMELCVDNGMFTLSFLKEGVAMFRGWLEDLLNEAWVACQGAELLIESPSAMAGIHIAEALRIPYYRAFTMPWTRTRAYPQAFAVPEHKRGGSYNYMTYVMFDNVFWRAIAGQVNHWRKTVLGIESTTFDKLRQDKTPFLYNFSPMVVPPPLDWTEWIHVTGYWFLDNADGKKDWTPPEGIVEFIDNAHAQGKKVVYIGFGSIVVSDPHEMTRCVVQGVVDSGVCAILSKGWSERGSRGAGQQPEVDSMVEHGADGVKFPPEIFSVDAIDHSWLFPRIDAACHHGGAGTTGASLRAGIPTIIKPFFGDQFFWAERVESLGIGSGLRQLTYEGLASALREATTNERQIAKAKMVGENIRQEEGVLRAIEAIYRDLEYARSLIKPVREPDTERRSRQFSVAETLSHITSRTHSRTNSRTQSHSRTQSGHSFNTHPSQSGRDSHTPSYSLSRSNSYSHSRTRSAEGGARSDESWSVVSDAGVSLPSSPRHSHVFHHDSDDDEHERERSLPALGNLVSNVTNLLSLPKGSHHSSPSPK